MRGETFFLTILRRKEGWKNSPRCVFKNRLPTLYLFVFEMKMNFFLSFENNLTVVKIICIGRFWRMKVPHLKATREYEESQISRRLFMVALETYASTNPFRESGNRDNCHRIFVTIQGRTRVVKDNTRVLNFTTRRTGDRLSGYLLKKMVEDGRYTMGDNF